ncbi:MAG: hypothetical protein IPO57_14850 [Rhodocyclales bacterium]|nr:hypothetical protein [Rhodocyclales bacterium]
MTAEKQLFGPPSASRPAAVPGRSAGSLVLVLVLVSLPLMSLGRAARLRLAMNFSMMWRWRLMEFSRRLRRPGVDRPAGLFVGLGG